MIATQLSPELTKNLVLTDPYRIKSTAESISVDFHIPNGVQLIIVYIPVKDYRKLIIDSQRAQTVTNQSNNNSTIIPFQFKKKIKRDKSIIFTNIPEESLPENGDFIDGITAAALPIKQNPPTKIMARPNHLPLRFKNITSKDLPESGFSSINFDETDSFPQFIGRTSVCSTPMTEMKVLHGTVLPICANVDKISPPKSTPNKSPETEVENSTFMMNPFKTETRRHSLSSVQDSLKKLRLSMRPFGHGLAKLSKSHLNGEIISPDEIEIDDFDKKTYRTITDPMYPVFNSEGAPISKYLFQDILDKQKLHANLVADSVNALIPIADEIKENYRIEGFDSEMKMSPVHCPIEVQTEKPSVPNRVALSLPLKSLTLDTDANKDVQSSVVSNIFEAPAHRKKLAGIQLTPLMTKLSILAMNDERSSGFSSWDTTPGCGGDQTTPGESTKMFRRRSSIKYEDIVDLNEESASKCNEMQRCELFVCGQQNMTMLLLLEESSARKHELVQALVSFFIYFFVLIF